MELSGIVVIDGNKYEVKKLEKPLDVTEQNGGIETIIEHEILGFDERVYIVQEITEDEIGFYFAMRAFGSDRGEMLVNLTDETAYSIANKVVMTLLTRGQE